MNEAVKHWYNKADPSSPDSPASANAEAAPATTIPIHTGAIRPNVAYLAYGQMEDGLKRLHTFALCYRPTNNNITWIEWSRAGADPRAEVLGMDAGLKIDRLYVGVAGADLLFAATAHQLIVQPPGVPGVAHLAGVWAPTGGVAALNIIAPVPGHVSFPGDVPAGSTFYEDVEWAAANGIAGGIGGGKLDAAKPEIKVHVVAYQGRLLRQLAGGTSAQSAGKK